MPELTVHAVSHPGIVRPQHQDSIAIGPFTACCTRVAPSTLRCTADDRIACFVVDGIGGHAHGEVASRVCTTVLVRALNEPAGASEALASHALHAANTQLYDAMADDPTLTGCGATVAGVLVEAEQLLVFNVGDSRVYRWQDGFLFQLSVDDTLQGAAPRRTLTQALGGATRPTAIAPHVLRESWLPGRRYLLCTDGLFDALSIDAMEAVLAGPPEHAIARLTELALAAGAPDNFSALLLLRE